MRTDPIHESLLRRDEFSVSNGSAIFECPMPLSAEDRDDVVQWLDLIRARLCRNGAIAGVSEQTARGEVTRQPGSAEQNDETQNGKQDTK